MKKKAWLGLLVFVVLMALVACGKGQPTGSNASGTKEEVKGESSQEASNKPTYPTEQINWTIAFGPGGGNDIMARTLINILEKHKFIEQTIVPENREGGSGAVGWGFVNKQHGNPYHVSTTSGSFITTPLLSDPGFNYENFTHIALMAADDAFLLLRSDSPYNTVEEFIDAYKGKKVIIGGIGAANVDRMMTAKLGQAADLDYEYVSFNAQGELIGAILSDSVHAIFSNPGLVIGQLEANELKALAFTGKIRLAGFPDITTFDELGYDITVSMPRGLVLPGDIPEEAREWWIDTMIQVAQTEEWKEYIDSNYLTEYILYGDDFTNYLKETSAVFETTLKELGVIQ